MLNPSHSFPTQSGPLLNLIVTLLAPVFLTATGGDLTLARVASAETISDYRAQTSADLIAIAQIIAFGLTALASLTRSMDSDIPLPLALRLRGNANACSRAAEQHRRARMKQNHPLSNHPLSNHPHSNANQQPERQEPAPPKPPAPDPAELIARISQTQQRTVDHLASFAAPGPTQSHDQQHARATWAAGAARVAAETAAEIASLPPEERHSAALWAEILNDCAKDLMTSDPAPRLRPGDRPSFEP